MHEVFTAVKGELVSAQLPLYTGQREVRAALIVSVGLGPVAGQTRLALAGGAHVDVSKNWVQANPPAVGAYYVQDPLAQSPEVIAADIFEAAFTLESDAPAEAQEVGSGEQAGTGHVVEDFAKLDEHPGFIEWFKEHANAELLGTKLANLFHRNVYGEDAPSGGHVLQQTAADTQIEQLTRERDGARARITDLEKQLAEANRTNQLIIEGTTTEPSAADLDKVAEEDKAAQDTEHKDTEQNPVGEVAGVETTEQGKE